MRLCNSQTFGLIALTISLFSFPASADIKQQLAGCASIQDKLDRLICYDALAERSAPSVAAATSTTASQTMPTTITPQVDVTTQTVVPPATTDNFGKIETPQVERVELQVKSVKKGVYGELTIYFENGQVWKQSDTRRFKFAAGDKVYINRGALGSYLLGKEDINSTIRVKRLN